MHEYNRFIRRPCRSVGPPALNFLALRSSWSDPLSDVLGHNRRQSPRLWEGIAELRILETRHVVEVAENESRRYGSQTCKLNLWPFWYLRPERIVKLAN